MILIFLCCCLVVRSQSIVEWNAVYQIQLSDFVSPASQIGEVNMYSVNTAMRMDFGYQMTNGEFMFAKNFNSKVTCAFYKDLAVIIAPDTATALQLLDFARFDFDLCELYSRKLRKRLYEEKGAFSDAGFFKPAFDEVQMEYTARHSQAAKDTDIGRDKTKLSVLHEAVRLEIAALPDFCKTCKPVKKKK